MGERTIGNHRGAWESYPFSRVADGGRRAYHLLSCSGGEASGFAVRGGVLLVRSPPTVGSVDLLWDFQ